MREITLVQISSPGCHNCEVFASFWENAQSQFPHVTRKEISIMSPEAAPYLAKHHILASPGIIIDDEFFSAGPVDTEALTHRLTELSKIA